MRNRFIALLVSSLLSIVLAGCGSESDLTSGGGISGAGQTYYGTVYTKEFIANAPVEILDARGTKIFYTTTTDSGGGIEVNPFFPAPNPLLIRVTTGDGLTLEREVENFDGRHLWVNVLTTLVARHHAAHAELTLAQSEAAVREALQIPAGVSFDGISDLSWSPFSHSVFFRAADAEGGFAAYLPRLLAAIESQQSPSFTRQPTTGSLGVFFPRQIAAKELGEYAVSLAESAASSVLTSAGSSILGKICAAAGLNVGSAGSYNAIQSDLAEIQSSLENLTEQLVIDSSRAEYNAILNSVNDDKALLKQLSGLLEQVRQQAENDATQFGTDKPRTTPPAVQTFLDFEVNENFDARASGTKIADLTVTKTDSNATLALGKAIEATLGISDPSRDYANYEMRRDDLTEELQNNFNYFAGLTVEAENIATEFSNTQYLPAPLGQSSQHPSISPLGVNSARSYVLDENMKLRQGTQLVAGFIGGDLLLVDMKPAKDAGEQNRHTMWYLKAHLKTYDDAQKYAETFEVNNLKGWRLPTFDEMDLLYSRIKHVSGSKTRDRMKKLHFENIDTSHDNDRKYWYQDSRYVTIDNYGIRTYHNLYYNLEKGGKDEDYFVSDSPKYTLLLVRSCPDFSSGDDPANALGYTNELDSLQEIRLDSSGNLMVTAKVKDTKGKEASVDVSNLVDWTTSNANLCDVVVSQSGAKASFHNTGDVTLTASYRGKSVSQTFPGAKPTLTQIAVTPRNLGYISLPQPNQFQQFDCTGYLSDNKASDLSSNDQNPDRVEWKLLTNGGADLPSDIATVSSIGVVTFHNTPMTEFVLRATHVSSGLTDQVSVKVIQ
jgi:uncharacterized protein YceK